MNELLLQLGVGGIFAILLIREVLGFLKTRNGNGNAAMLEKFIDVYKEEGRLMRHELRNNVQVVMNEIARARMDRH